MGNERIEETRAYLLKLYDDLASFTLVREASGAAHCAALLAEARGFSHASCDPARWHGELCSASPLFTSRDIGFATFSSMFGTLSFDEAAAVYVEQGTEAFERFSETTASDLARSLRGTRARRTCCWIIRRNA